MFQNTRLKEALKDVEKKGRGRSRGNRSMMGLEKEVNKLFFFNIFLR